MSNEPQAPDYFDRLGLNVEILTEGYIVYLYGPDGDEKFYCATEAEVKARIAEKVDSGVSKLTVKKPTG